MFDPSTYASVTIESGLSIWHYRTPDKIEAVCDPGYFAAATNKPKRGDLVYVVADTSSKSPTYAFLVVVSAEESGHLGMRMVFKTTG